MLRWLWANRALHPRSKCRVDVDAAIKKTNVVADAEYDDDNEERLEL
jgi:hypothetical protein